MCTAITEARTLTEDLTEIPFGKRPGTKTFGNRSTAVRTAQASRWLSPLFLMSASSSPEPGSTGSRWKGGRHAGAMLRDSFVCGIVLNVYIRTDNLRYRKETLMPDDVDTLETKRSKLLEEFLQELGSFGLQSIDIVRHKGFLSDD